MKIYSFKVNGYITNCSISCKTLRGAIVRCCSGLSIAEDDILEIKRIFRPIIVEFETKK